MAKIYDIEDEDIQKEYISAFNGVINFYDDLKIMIRRIYDDSEELLANYKNAFNLFKSNLKFKLLLLLIRYYWYFN